MSELPRFRDIHWSWQSKDSDVLVGYMGIDGRISLAALIAHMRDIAPDAKLDDIGVNFATVKWTRPATGDELAEREAWQARQRERTEEWERAALARLMEKYGTRADRTRQ